MSKKSGEQDSLSTARHMASLVALSIPTESIVPESMTPTEMAIASCQMRRYKDSRRRGGICLLSATDFNQGKSGNGGRITAAATTGPARAPRPASSIPAIRR